MKKRYICFLSAFVFLLGSCAASETGSDNISTESDASTAQTNTETVEAESDTENTADNVPELSFGKDMNLLMPEMSWATQNIIAEEMTGERVNDAQYNMKNAIEERFETSIIETYTSDVFSTTYVSNLVKGDDSSFDICFVLDLYAPNYIKDKMVIPCDELKYIDLSKPYWDDSLNKCVTFNNKTYFAFGAYDLSYYDLTHILTFNKTLVQNYSLDNPYELVENGKWTLDAFYKMAQATTADVDGDGTMTVDDSYGFVSSPKQVLPNFWMAAGEKSIAKDKDDLPYLNIDGNERFFGVVEKVFQMMWDGGIWYPTSEDSNFGTNVTQQFSADRALFAGQTFYYLREFRDIETDFGIIPFPKYNEEQNGYYSRVEGGCKIAIVPITNKNPEYAGALLESMASYGYNNVIPEYYEVALKRKSSRDSESLAMLDLIFSVRQYDLGDTWWCNDLRDGMFKPMFINNKPDLSSEIAKRQKSLSKSIKRTVDAIVEQ